MEKRILISVIMKYYSANWRQEWKRIFTDKNFNEGYFFSWEFLFPFYLCLFFEDISVRSILLYYFLTMPFMLGMLHSFMYPNRMEKTMFLCPVGGKEKKQFLETGYRLRIFLVAAVTFFILSILCLSGVLEHSVYLNGFFVSVLVFSCITFLGNDVIQFKNASEFGLGGYCYWRISAWFASFISCLLLGMAAIELEEYEIYEAWENRLFFCVFFLQLVLALKLIVSYYNRLMEIGADYEKSYGME